MQKKTVKRATMLNFKSTLILISFGIWVYVIMKVGEEINTLKDAFFAYGGKTVMIIVVSYLVLVIVGLFVEIESTDET